MTMIKQLSRGTWIGLLMLCCTPGICLATNDSDVPDMIKVHRKLIKYEEIVPPSNYTEALQIYVTLYPMNLVMLDTAQQIFSFVGMFYFTWAHTSLAWNPSDYGGVTSVTLPGAKIWKPEFEILNSAVSNTYDASSLNKHGVLVYSDGNASWYTSEVSTTSCDIKPEYFPFDTQDCNLFVFGAKITGYENFTAVKVDLEEYAASTEWSLLKTSVTDLTSPFPQMRFSFKFKRKSDFYVLTMIIPLITLSIVGLLIFPLPAQSGERVSFGMAILLSFVVLQASVTPYLPTSYKTTPYIVMVIFALMIFNALAISATMVLTSIMSAEPRPKMPAWLHKLLSKSAKVGVHNNPDSTPSDMKLEDADATDASSQKSSLSDMKKCSRCSANRAEEDLDEKWQKFEKLANNFLFIVFSIALVILILVILAVWTAGASASQVL